LEDGHADGGADDDDGHRRKGEPDGEPDTGGDLAQPVEPLDPVPTEAHVLDDRERADTLRDARHRRGVALPGPQPDLDRGGKRIHVEIAEHGAELGELAPRPPQRLLLAHIERLGDLGEGAHVVADLHCRFDRCAGEEVRDDLDAFLDRRERCSKVDGDEPEQTDDVEREGDRHHRKDREQRGSPKCQQGFAQRQGHPASPPSSCAES
jgi:hypothetical protein